RAASSAQVTPVGPGTWNDVIHVEGFTPNSLEDAVAWTNAVSDWYFATMGIPLVAGRDFNPQDRPGTPRVALASRTTANKFCKDESAIGKTFRLEEGPTGLGQPITIIGVVGDTKYQSLREKTAPVVYFASRQDTTLGPYTNFEIRTDGSPTSLIPSVTLTLEEINPRISLDFIPLEQQWSESLTMTRTVATLSGFFGGLALVLAV